MNLWSILGLDRSTATEREVKSAYAKLLKQHRPDKDPEGFQRLRQAYEVALQVLRSSQQEYQWEEQALEDSTANALQQPEDKQKGAAELPLLDQAAPSVPEAPEYSAEMEARLAELRQAIETEEGVRGGLVRVFAQVKADGLSPRKFELLLKNAFAQKPLLLAEWISHEELTYLLQDGQVELGHFCINVWQEAIPPKRALELGAHLLVAAKDWKDQDCAVVMARLAVVCGYDDKTLAKKLADLAYPNLPLDQRDHIMPEVDYQIQLGALFHGFPREMKRFWRLRMRNQAGDYDWSTPEAQAALNYVLKVRGQDWAGCNLVLQMLPQEARNSFEADVKKKLLKTLLQQKKNTSHQEKKMHWKWALTIVLFLILRAIVYWNNPSRLPPTPPPNYTQEERQRLTEALRPKPQPSSSTSSKQQLTKEAPKDGPISTELRPIVNPEALSEILRSPIQVAPQKP
jgi:hypothetical protein